MADAARNGADTRNVFIEVTATDVTKASVVLDQLVAMFSEYCADPFTFVHLLLVYLGSNKSLMSFLLHHESFEPVNVVYPNGDVQTYPAMPYRFETVCFGASIEKSHH